MLKLKLMKPKTDTLIIPLMKYRLYFTTIATLKRKNKRCGTEEVPKLFKDSLETGLTREHCNAFLGELISNKSVKQNTINNGAGLSLPKDEINHDDRNNDDDTVSHDNTNSHDDTYVLKEYFSSYQVKCKGTPKC